MQKQTNRWKLGLFVVAAVATAFGALLWLGTAQLRREKRTVVTYFDEAVTGLDLGAKVKLRGVDIGEVSAIALAPDRRRVEVHLDLYVDELRRIGLERPDDAEAGLADDLRVQLAQQGIMGGQFVQADFFDIERYPPPKLPFATPPNYLPSVPSTFKSIETALIEAVNFAPEIRESVKDLIERLERLVSEIDARGISSRVVSTLGTVEEKVRELDAAGLALRADELVATVGRAVDEAKLEQTTASVRAAAADAAHAARSLALLGEDLRGEIAELRGALDAFRRLADLLERDPGALIHGKTPAETETTR